MRRGIAALCLTMAACMPPRPMAFSPPGRLVEHVSYAADGRVIRVERAEPEDASSCWRLIFEPKAEAPIAVELGPGWYLEARGFRLAANEPISVKGQRFTQAEQSWVIANSIRKGDATLTLRDDTNRPLWGK